MKRRIDPLRVLRDADPVTGRPPGAAEPGLLERIMATERPSDPSSPRPRRKRRARTAVACALLLGAGGTAVAGLMVDRRPPPQVAHSLTEALSLPAPDRDELLPTADGMRVELDADTDFGRWMVVSTETRGRGTFVAAMPVEADGSLRKPTAADPHPIAGGLGSCGARPPAARPLRLCTGGGTNVRSPNLIITGRHHPSVRGIQLRLPDGSTVAGHLGLSYNLVLVGNVEPGPLAVEALDNRGLVAYRLPLRNPFDDQPLAPRP